MDHLYRPSIERYNQGSTCTSNPSSPTVIGPDVTTDANDVSLEPICLACGLKQHCSAILKRAHELRKRLEPESTLHLQAGRQDASGWDTVRDLKPLRDAVTTASDLIDRISDSADRLSDLADRLSEPRFPAVEFECAWNGIMPSKLRK